MEKYRTTSCANLKYLSLTFFLPKIYKSSANIITIQITQKPKSKFKCNNHVLNSLNHKPETQPGFTKNRVFQEFCYSFTQQIDDLNEIIAFPTHIKSKHTSKTTVEKPPNMSSIWLKTYSASLIIFQCSTTNANLNHQTIIQTEHCHWALLKRANFCKIPCKLPALNLR